MGVLQDPMNSWESWEKQREKEIKVSKRVKKRKKKESEKRSQWRCEKQEEKTKKKKGFEVEITYLFNLILELSFSSLSLENPYCRSPNFLLKIRKTRLFISPSPTFLPLVWIYIGTIFISQNLFSIKNKFCTEFSFSSKSINVCKYIYLSCLELIDCFVVFLFTWTFKFSLLLFFF